MDQVKGAKLKCYIKVCFVATGVGKMAHLVGSGLEIAFQLDVGPRVRLEFHG
jgi:hypothetical protein